jgi:hypothetical protein
MIIESELGSQGREVFIPRKRMARTRISSLSAKRVGAKNDKKFYNSEIIAGFVEVKVVDEKPFGVAVSFENDPMVKAIAQELGVTLEELRNLSQVVVSMKVEGKKAPHGPSI